MTTPVPLLRADASWPFPLTDLGVLVDAGLVGDDFVVDTCDTLLDRTTVRWHAKPFCPGSVGRVGTRTVRQLRELAHNGGYVVLRCRRCGPVRLPGLARGTTRRLDTLAQLGAAGRGTEVEMVSALRRFLAEPEAVTGHPQVDAATDRWREQARALVATLRAGSYFTSRYAELLADGLGEWREDTFESLAGLQPELERRVWVLPHPTDVAEWDAYAVADEVGGSLPVARIPAAAVFALPWQAFDLLCVDHGYSAVEVDIAAAVAARAGDTGSVVAALRAASR